MADLALYRKYRSRDFSEVIGQSHVTTTLNNALKNGRLSHAYLFTGPRGTGKTSVARLLARAANCTSQSAAKPCNECQLCLLQGAANLDLIEIDAASNRRIDEIRDLRDKIGLSPAQGRYKVYIIDEVHMLTTEAFNALLKTLEEPPAHAIFILATTEAHKLPDTITSRTQRFSFRPLSTSDLTIGLQRIAAAERINIEPAALELIATAGRGSLRDAISLLDQAASLDAGPISLEAVRGLLGLTNQELLQKLATAILTDSPAEALEAWDEASAAGIQPIQLSLQLCDYFRQLLRSALAPHQAPAAERELATASDPHRISTIVQTLMLVPRSPSPELALETSLVRLSSTPRPASAPAPVAEPPVAAPPAAKPTTRPVVSPPAGDDEERWLKALMVVKGKNNSLYALLRSCQYHIIESELTLSCRFNFHRDRITEPKNRQLLEQALTKVYGRNLRVVCQVDQASPPPDPASELVTQALDILGGEVVDG